MERKYSIDLLRVISAIAVIIIHIVSAPVVNSPIEVDAALKTNLGLVHTLMNWSVPVFFMMTGFCLMKKKECTYKYCFAHVVKYVCVLFTVGLFYAFLEEVFIAKTVSIPILIRSALNVVSGNLWDHMWFVYTIIGIYMVMPIIHRFMHHGRQDSLILTVLLFLFNIVFPTLEKWISIGVVLPFGGYLFYVCYGGILASVEVDKKTSHFLYLTGVLSVVWIILDPDRLEFGYKHLSVCLMAMSIFLFLSRMHMKENKFLLCVSQCTWGIYLIHPFFINIAIKLLDLDLITHQPFMKLSVFGIIIFLVSLAATYILRKIPILKKLF